jgi:hypothetical protein
MSAPWEQDRYSFTGPGVAISCKVDYDNQRGLYLATSGSGFRGTGESRHAAALACFRAWVTSDAGWFEAPAPGSGS